MDNFVQVFPFITDTTKPGRTLATARIGELYMSRLTIAPGITTGNLYHKRTAIMFFVEKGNVLSAFKHIHTQQEQQLSLTPGSQVVHIPVNIAHATKNVGEEDAVIIFFTDHKLRTDDDIDYHVLD